MNIISKFKGLGVISSRWKLLGSLLEENIIQILSFIDISIKGNQKQDQNHNILKNILFKSHVFLILASSEDVILKVDITISN